MPSTTINDQTINLIEKNIHVNNIRLTYFEHGIANRGLGPTLLFVHATGFHARVWDKIIRQFSNHHIITIDQRGHGRSEKKLITHWDEVVTDLTELITSLNLTNIIGIGHSMGAHALIGAAGRVESLFNRIVAIDPVIPIESSYLESSIQDAQAETQHPTAKRRREFSSPEEMAERLRPKGSFSLFDPEMFMDYCRFGLLPLENGNGYTLACPPEVEASVYMSSRSNHDIYETVRSVNLPILILRAQEPAPDRNIMDFSASPTWPGLVNEFKNAREVFFPDKTHFLPMQIPAEVTLLIQTEIELSSQAKVNSS